MIRIRYSVILLSGLSLILAILRTLGLEQTRLSYAAGPLAPFTIHGTAGNDILTVTPVDADTISYAFANGPAITVHGVHSLQFNGYAGDDLLIVDGSSGVGSLVSGGITYYGGTQTTPQGDALNVIGDGLDDSLVYQPDASTFGNGVFHFNNVDISFVGLEPLDISGMATLTIAPFGADDVLTLTNGTDFFSGGVNPAIRISGTTGGTAIETLASFNNTTLVVDTTLSDGNDTITINSADNAHNHTNLTIMTGSGTDAVNVNGNVQLAGTMSIATGGSIVNGGGTLSAMSLKLDSGTGAGTLASPINTSVTTLAARTFTSGDLAVQEADSLTISVVDGLSGFSAVGSTQVEAGQDVTLESGISIVASGSAFVILDAARSIMLKSGSHITTTNGDIVLKANQRTTPTLGNFVGLDLDNANLSSTSGTIILQGRGGDDGGGDDFGIRLANNSQIDSPNNGNVNFEGTGSGGAADIFWDSLSLSKTGGTFLFNDTVEGTTLTVNAGAYSVVFNDGGTITNDVNFLNTGTIILGNDASDSFAFDGGLDTTAASSANIAGIVSTTNNQMDLGVVTVIANSTLVAGEIDFQGGANSVDGLVDLTLRPASSAANITVGQMADSGGTVFDLTDTDLAALADGFSSITIGDANSGTGTVTVYSSTFNDPVVIVGGSLSVTGLDAGANDVLLTARVGQISEGGLGTDVTGATVTLNGIIAPGGSPGQLVISGDVTLVSTDIFTVELSGTVPRTQHDQIQVTGPGRTVTLNDATLNASLGWGYTPGLGDQLVIIDNVEAGSSVIGTFNGLPEGSIIALGEAEFQISYAGGTDDNDVVLTAAPAAVIYLPILMKNTASP